MDLAISTVFGGMEQGKAVLEWVEEKWRVRG